MFALFNVLPTLHWYNGHYRRSYTYTGWKSCVKIYYALTRDKKLADVRQKIHVNIILHDSQPTHNIIITAISLEINIIINMNIVWKSAGQRNRGNGNIRRRHTYISLAHHIGIIYRRIYYTG